eukprot:UN09102
MKQRANKSTNTNFMLIQHYAGSGEHYISTFKTARGNKKDGDVIWTAGGHSHAQECIHWNNDGICEAIKTGGGGHGAASSRKGFWVVGFDENKKMIQPISYNSSTISCFNPCGQKISKQEIEESNLFNCCHDEDEAVLCGKGDKQKCKIKYSETTIY